MHSQFNSIMQNRNTFNCFDCDVAVAVLNIITRDSKCGVNLKHVLLTLACSCVVH